MPRQWCTVVGIVAVLVLAGGAALWLRPAPAAESADVGAAPPTAAVTRTDLAERTRREGTLGYDGNFSVPGGTGASRVTWLPAVGAVVARGARVFSVDNRPIPLLIGDTPLWRELSAGVSDGPDVRLLRQNLHDLGVAPRLDTASEHFSEALGDALGIWQRALGVDDTERLVPADVVTAPGELRVVEVRAVLGAPAPPVVLVASGTTRVVTVDLPVGDQTLATVGAPVSVLLPTGPSTIGRVLSVGAVATATEAPESQDDRRVSATVPVRVTLDRPQDAGVLDQAPVSVEFTSAVHRQVLAVPVVALLALRDGGYAVDVVEGGQGSSWSRKRIPVEVGFFATGLVEVRGGGLAEGARVEVPGR
ncbi:peptidoglycan-binding protein [Amycolatopsis sp. A133]|uniref:peptidoglycan-binding protein n=1 Tax=Amycolatopsis sp. A133 TaxID=3064472 RepID=UPI0027F919A7|nr:peptidoglycan-binding protein [Amycolatopsis sp. A133]MDQ7809105.1 peptidoglycan-binding protein [Amycolatopsis sp. A133]